MEPLSLKERLLSHYGWKEEDFADNAREPSFADFPKLDDFPQAQAMKKRLLLAAEKKEKVLIYGDYDTDGIMATSIMVRSLRHIGLNPQFYIPSRYTDGYGLNLENAEKIAQKGYALVLCVDNGINAVHEVAYLMSKGVETLIIDHHEPGPALPAAKATIHPKLCQYGPYEVSAGYLCFAFSRFLLEKDDEYLATLGALSTISDCMPLKGYNRKLVALALRFLRARRFPEIALLTEKRRIDEKTLGMEIIPAINAVGRLDKDGKISRLVHYFADEEGDKEKIASFMKETNALRKEATKAAEAKLHLDLELPGLVVVGSLPEGLNGLLANKLLGAYDKPVVVLSPAESDDAFYVGSIRSREGFDVIAFQKKCGGLIERGGGHAFAGGVTVAKEKYAAFRDAFLSFAAAHPFVKKKEDLIPLEMREANMDAFRLIRQFGPFGQEHHEPAFLLEEVPTESLRFTRDGRFLSTLIAPSVRLFSFSFGRENLDVRKPYYDFRATFALDEYKGNASLTIFLNPLGGKEAR